MRASELIKQINTIRNDEFGGDDFDLYLGINDNDLADIGEILVSSSNTSNSASIEAKR